LYCLSAVPYLINFDFCLFNIVEASNADDRVPGEQATQSTAAPDDDDNHEESPEEFAEGKIFIPKSISVPYT
jgi:hypothetical protein